MEQREDIFDQVKEQQSPFFQELASFFADPLGQDREGVFVLGDSTKVGSKINNLIQFLSFFLINFHNFRFKLTSQPTRRHK